MLALIKNTLKNESGATAIEYGLIAALIAVVCVTIFTNIGTSLQNTFTKVNNGLNQ